MIEVLINYWAVLTCVVISIMLGSLWYGPLFGKQWMRLVGITKEQMEEGKKKGMKGMRRSYALMALGSLVMAWILAHSLAYAKPHLGVDPITAGLVVGFMSWAGFIAPATLGSVLWEGKPWKYWFITAGYYLVLLLSTGVVLSLWV